MFGETVKSHKGKLSIMSLVHGHETLEWDTAQPETIGLARDRFAFEFGRGSVPFGIFSLDTAVPPELVWGKVSIVDGRQQARLVGYTPLADEIIFATQLAGG